MKRILSVLLCLCMMMSVIVVMAEEASAAEEFWLWPAPECYIISSNFGWRDYAKSPTHTGIDIVNSSTPFGKTVVASKSGTVLTANNSFGDYEKCTKEQEIASNGMLTYGNYVIVDHGDGTYAIYAHMRKDGIKMSGYVNQGDTIGYIGDSGSSDGAHLHFQIFTNPSSLSGSSMNTMPANSNIQINHRYELPAGWHSEKINYIFSTNDRGYLGKCEFYNSNLSVKITKATTLKSLPCSKGTDAESKDVYTAKVGDSFRVTGMYKNTAGNYWYQTEYNGETCYFYAGAAEVTKCYGDATINNVSAPDSLLVGGKFTIRGNISTKNTWICEVGTLIKVAGNTDTYMQAYSTVPDGKNYNLENSTVDYGTKFNELPEGRYTYDVYVCEKVWYSSDGTTLAEKEMWSSLYKKDFKVGNPPEQVNYLDQCTFYDTNITVKVVNKTTMKTLPCSKGTNADSKDVRVMSPGDVCNVTGIYTNTVGNFWYEAECNGYTGYIYAGDTEISTCVSGAEIVGVKAPKQLNEGERFTIEGLISSEGNHTYKVRTMILRDNQTIMVKTESVSSGTKYELKNSALDMAMKFNELPAGEYFYEIEALEQFYYSKDGSDLRAKETGITLYKTKFTVGSGMSEKKSITDFTDINMNAYYVKPIKWALENGIAEGTSATKFEPNKVCSRAEIITYLWRAAGCPEARNSEALPFVDVPKNADYVDAVKWALKKEITSGTSATTFSPNKTVTRAQAMTFLWKSLNAPNSTMNNPFVDIARGMYYVDSVRWAVQNGITSGTSATLFSPNNGCTRAHVLTFLYNCRNL